MHCAKDSLPGCQAVTWMLSALKRFTWVQYCRIPLHSCQFTCAWQVEILDVACLASVAAFADRWDAHGRPLHALINNAGIFTLAGCASPYSPDAALEANALLGPRSWLRCLHIPGCAVFIARLYSALRRSFGGCNNNERPKFDHRKHYKYFCCAVLTLRIDG